MTCLPNEIARQVPRTPVTVNGQEIAYETIAQEVQFHSAPSLVQAWQTAARALVVRALLLQEAQRLNLKPNPATDGTGLLETNDEALIRQLIELAVATPEPDETACRRYYEQNHARFRSPTIVEASHILLAASRDDADTYATRCAEAQTLIDALLQRPSEFSAMAGQVSDCPSAAQGGNLGQLSPGQTTPDFEAALAKMAPGEISSEPVESPYGIHIIQLRRRIDGDLLPFQAVKSRIAAYLQERVTRMATAQYLARLVSSARIAGVAMPEAQDLRVF